MKLWFAAFLGLVQGLTEFLPISSTAHLRIAPALLGMPDPGAAFTAVIQLGSVVAVIGYFARDVFVTMPRDLLRDPRSPEGRFPLLLVLGTVPVVVVGLGMKKFITGDARSLYVIASTLIGVGALFFVAERVGTRTRAMLAIGWSDAFIIGLAQACAVVPGVSRSGSTICAALFLGMKREDAARFSFLLGIPAITGAGVYELHDALSKLGSSAIPALLVGIAVAAVASYASIAWLLRFLSRNSLNSFGVYRIALGLLLVVLCLSGVVPAL